MLLTQKNYVLRVSDYDLYDRLRPSAVLDIFQDIAGQNADEIGVGYRDLLRRDLIWVLLRSRYDVTRYPELYSEVTVRTWPQPRGRGDFDRDYEIVDKSGNTLVKGSSKWCVLNVKTRRIVFGDEVVYKEDEYCPVKNYPDGLKKIKDFSTDGFSAYRGKTAYCDLDHNGHINNIKYADYILNALAPGKDEKISSFEIDYIHELSSGADFDVLYGGTDGVKLVKCTSEGREVFRARIATTK